MRGVVLIATVVATAATAMFVARAAENKPTASPPGSAIAGNAAPAGQPPASLVGQDVRVYFRGSDDISSWWPEDGTVQLAKRIKHVDGKVLQVHPGWIELENKERPGPHGRVDPHNLGRLRERQRGGHRTDDTAIVWGVPRPAG